MTYDVAIFGAGSSGLMAAIFAAREGASVLLIEHAPDIGGSLHVAGGHMSAAGTRLQKKHNISDSPDQHFDDVMRISRGTADPSMVRIAVEGAADTLHWLIDHGLEVGPDHPVLVFGHEPYQTPRTYWGSEKAVSVLNVLRTELEKELSNGLVSLMLESELVDISLGEDHRIHSALVRKRDQIAEPVEASNFVLSCGGYAANQEMFPALTGGYPLFSQAYPFSQGTGIRLVDKLGGIIQGGEHFLPTFGRIEDPYNPGRISNFTITVPQARPPWEVYLNLLGQRFVNEEEPSADKRERALLEQPDLTFWALFDTAIKHSAPSLFQEISEDQVEALWNNHHSFVRADTLESLAEGAGLPIQNVVQTTSSYNEAVAHGHDDLGRSHLPLPIAEPPFYAVKHHGISVISFAGVAVTQDFQVRAAEVGAIDNLFAVGEMLGAWTFSGNAFVSGMSVTPALTFGRLLGQKIGRSNKASSTLGGNRGAF